MKWRKFITLIISVDEGRSLYWSLPRWQLFLGTALIALTVILLLLGSIGYLFNHGRLQKAVAELASITKQAQQFEDRLFFENKRAFEVRNYSPTVANVGDSNDDGYQTPLLLKNARAWVSSGAVELDFSLQLRSISSTFEAAKLPTTLSGTMVAVLANEDKKPVNYVSLPKMAVTERGFPNNRFAGIHFYQVRRNLRFHRKVKLSVDKDYFTHVDLYVFSLRGGIVWHQRFQMEQEWFSRPLEREPRPLVSVF